MRLTALPQTLRNVNRATEILSVLSRYGLADWLSRLNLEFAKGLIKDSDGEALARHTREARIRMALAALGPTFIKLGQLLSTRPELVGQALADELQTLRDAAPAVSGEQVRKMIEEELGQPIEALFAEFSETPLASASIGQVHAVTLRDGTRAVVKVQRAGIENMMRRDLDVMAGFAQLVERLPEFETYRPVETVAEMRRVLLRELDFGREERSLQQFAAKFADNPKIKIPQPFVELSTSRVLTMERLEGDKLTALSPLSDTSVDCEAIAQTGAKAYLEMIFVDGFYHADPHPGNLLILPGNVIGLLDFGMVGRIDERLREDVEETMMAMMQRDPVHLARLISRIGKTPPQLDEIAFRSDLADFVAMYGNQSLDQFDLSGALSEIIEMIYRYRISLPPQVSLLLKTLITLEGTAKLLHPTFSIMEMMRPFQSRALVRRFSPKQRLKKFRRVYLEMEHLAELLPKRVMEILNQVQAGEFDVHLDHRGLGPSVNRLVLGMMVSALFLGSSLMLSQKVPPLLFHQATFLGMQDLSLLGLAGCGLSLAVGLRLLRAIVKSGNLDQRD